MHEVGLLRWDDSARVALLVLALNAREERRRRRRAGARSALAADPRRAAHAPSSPDRPRALTACVASPARRIRSHCVPDPRCVRFAPSACVASPAPNALALRAGSSLRAVRAQRVRRASRAPDALALRARFASPRTLDVRFLILRDCNELYFQTPLSWCAASVNCCIFRVTETFAALQDCASFTARYSCPAITNSAPLLDNHRC
jgi:hypothetical protein